MTECVGKTRQVSAADSELKGSYLTTRKYLPAAPEVRFQRFYEVAENGCWIWTGRRNEKGYGYFTAANRKRVRAHRWAYEFYVGPIPAGLVLDHYVCENRACVNPDHLRPVTTRENLLRSDKTQAALNSSKKKCKRGHDLPPFTGEWRQCAECKRLKGRAA